MKQIGVRLEEELVKKAKQYALDNSISLQNIISEALTSYLDNKLTTTPTPQQPKKQQANKLASKKDNKLTNKQVNKPTPPTERKFDTGLIQNDHYLLRKPYYELRPETQHTRKTNLMVEWWLEAGDTQYMDEDQKIIPFRYRKADGTDYTPNEAEMKLLEEAYEKPVILEE